MNLYGGSPAPAPPTPAPAIFAALPPPPPPPALATAASTAAASAGGSFSPITYQFSQKVSPNMRPTECMLRRAPGPSPRSSSVMWFSQKPGALLVPVRVRVRVEGR